MLRAILFDFNGVLVDDEPIHCELLRRALGEEGLELTEAEYYEKYLGLDDRTAFTRALEEAGEEVTPHRLFRLVARKSTYYQIQVRDRGFPVAKGAVDLVRTAHGAGLMLGVVSGALRDEVEGALDQMTVRECFKCLVTADDVQAGKPDPEGYRLGLTQLNSTPPLPDRLLHPHEVLAIEDSPTGLEAAARSGFSTLAISNSYTAERLGKADHLVETLEGLDLSGLNQMFSG